MNDAGAKVNEIEVVKGVVYLDARSKGDDIYRMRTGDSTFARAARHPAAVERRCRPDASGRVQG